MNKTKKKKHIFLIFMIIFVVLNVCILPFTYKYIKAEFVLLGAIDIKSQAPDFSNVPDYNLSDQEFANEILYHWYDYRYDMDAVGNDLFKADYYYFYYDDVINFPKIVDEQIEKNEMFSNRNELIYYLRTYKDYNCIIELCYDINEYTYGVRLLDENKIILENGKTVIIGVLSTREDIEIIDANFTYAKEEAIKFYSN